MKILLSIFFYSFLFNQNQIVKTYQNGQKRFEGNYKKDKIFFIDHLLSYDYRHKQIDKDITIEESYQEIMKYLKEEGDNKKSILLTVGTPDFDKLNQELTNELNKGSDNADIANILKLLVLGADIETKK